MSSISSISSGSSAWSSAGAVRNGRPPGGPDPAKMFAKVDTDGSGGVDQTELQSLLDKVSKQAGTDSSTASISAADTFTKFDTNGDGSLSQSELGEGMKSLMPAPSSTVEFAQGRGGEAGGPPPGGAAPASDSSKTYDPLDTNQDGVVSAQEQAVGDATQTALDSLVKAVDSNQDGKLSSSEMDTFKQVLTDQLDTAVKSMQDGGSSSASSTDTSSSDKSSRFDLKTLASMVLKEYAAMADASQQSSASQIRVAA